MSATMPPGEDRSPANGRQPAVDLEAALAEIPGGFETACELAGLFLEECPRVLRQMCEALDDGDARTLRRGAHTLKGSAAIFAARALVESADRLERAAAAGDLDGLSGPLTEVKDEAARVTQALKRLCAGG